ncbi:hypothetical protein [Streptomyces sp. NPDC098781]|uniref:hypothetical protein n=1 Tax=Streptomyces sp. NPDC098781 TaxID=3366097 RepID=UPI00380007F8
MNETFATTVAAVVPVVLLVAVVEISHRRQVLRAWYARAGEHQRRIDALYADGQTASGEQLEAAEESLLGSSSAPLRDLWPLLYVLSAAAVGALLLVVEAVALVWLAHPGSGNAPGLAAFCLGATLTGFGWVTVAPLLAFVVSSASDFWVVTKGFGRQIRFVRELSAHRRQEERKEE